MKRVLGPGGEKLTINLGGEWPAFNADNFARGATRRNACFKATIHAH